jgi:hypothetical protein
LGAQQIFKEFKQPVDKDTYEAGGSDTIDDMVTAVSRDFHFSAEKSDWHLMKKVYAKSL